MALPVGCWKDRCTLLVDARLQIQKCVNMLHLYWSKRDKFAALETWIQLHTRWMVLTRRVVLHQKKSPPVGVGAAVQSSFHSKRAVASRDVDTAEYKGKVARVFIYDEG